MGDFDYQPPQRFRSTNKQRDEAKKQKSGASGGIPDRWLDYLGVHTWIEGTRFIAFKCPLKLDMQKQLPEDRRFTLGDLVEKLDDKGKELGLIIDLTNTYRYYTATDIADAQIQYHKLMTPGHNRVPSERCYVEFVDVVKSFLQSNTKNDKLIGVHCTHGLNRTGYLIVRYMIENMAAEPQEAIEAFNRARGHSMEKYTEELLKIRKPPSMTQPNDSETHTMSTIQSVNNNDRPLEQHIDTGMKWPSLSSTIEAMSLTDRDETTKQCACMPRSIDDQMLAKEASQLLPNSSVDTSEIKFSSVSQQQQESFSNQQNNQLYRKTSADSQIPNLTKYEKDESVRPRPTTFFGAGSNIGRGRPLTGDR